MKSIAIGSFLLICSLAGCAPPASPTFFSYEAGLPSKWGGYVVVMENDPGFRPFEKNKPNAHEGFTIRGGDMVSYYRDCREETNYACLLDDYVVFVLPRRISEGTTHWRYTDRLNNRYEFVVEERDIWVQIFGRRIDGLYRISVPPAYTKRGRKYGDRFTFLYSSEMGVVAFSYIPPPDDKRNAVTFWTSELPGFGTQKRARQQSPAYLISR